MSANAFAMYFLACEGIAGESEGKGNGKNDSKTKVKSRGRGRPRHTKSKQEAPLLARLLCFLT